MLVHDYKAAHEHSTGYRRDVRRSPTCGCFGYRHVLPADGLFKKDWRPPGRRGR